MMETKKNIISYQCCPKPAEKDVSVFVINREKVINREGSCFSFVPKAKSDKAQSKTKITKDKTDTKGSTGKKTKKE